MTETQTEKGFPLNTSLYNVGEKIGSDNDLKAVKWSVHFYNEENYVLQSSQHKNKNES